ncbi:hypothetical protein C8R45DRAFT_833668, partial [Mycena sanguinolenta]
RTSHAFVEAKGRIVGALIGAPNDPTWPAVVQRATGALHHEWLGMSFPSAAYEHRRGDFAQDALGRSFGGGRKTAGNITPSSASNGRAMNRIARNPDLGRILGHALSGFKAFFWGIFGSYHALDRALTRLAPQLSRLPSEAPYAALSVNFEHAFSPPHLNGANSAGGMCEITPFGNFDPDTSTHLVLWDFGYIIRFPPGTSAIIPSAVVTHSNTPLQKGETRFSVIRYTAGALFRWVANGGKTDLEWEQTATEGDRQGREEARRGRWQEALARYTRWKDLKLGNFQGTRDARADAILDLTRPVEDLSDLSDAPQAPPRKRMRRT